MGRSKRSVDTRMDSLSIHNQIPESVLRVNSKACISHVEWMSGWRRDDITFLSHLKVDAPTWTGALKAELRLVVTHECVNQKLPTPHKPANACLAHR